MIRALFNMKRTVNKHVHKLIPYSKYINQVRLRINGRHYLVNQLFMFRVHFMIIRTI